MDVARSTGRTFVDGQITEMVCKRLRISPDELKAFQSGFGSFMGRLLNSVSVSPHLGGGFNSGYFWFPSYPSIEDYYVENEGLTKQRYKETHGSVVRKLVADEDVVFHGNAAHLFVPRGRKSYSVFLETTLNLRVKRFADGNGLSINEAKLFLEKKDKTDIASIRHLLGFDVLDKNQYSLVINSDEFEHTSIVASISQFVSAQMEGVRALYEENELTSAGVYASQM